MRPLGFLLLLAVVSACSAPVALKGHPGPDVLNVSLSECNHRHREVHVFMEMPKEGWEEIGWIELEQLPTRPLHQTSREDQVRAARVQACVWGADAICILDRECHADVTYSPLSVIGRRDRLNTFVVALRRSQPVSK